MRALDHPARPVALLIVEQIGHHDLTEDLLMHGRLRIGSSASTLRSRLRGIKSADEI